MIVLAIAFLALVVIALRAGARGHGYLDWDPDEHLRVRAARDEADTEDLLRLHNERRVARGLPAQTHAEFAERVRRGR
jgi:hypothetical protein